MADNQKQRSDCLLKATDADLLDTISRIIKRTSLDSDDCLICTMATNKPGTSSKKIVGSNNEIVTIEVDKGYPKVRLPNHGTFVFCHHVIYMYKERENRGTDAFKAMWLDPSMDISHICGKPRCVNEDCLTCENHDKNVTRDFCHGLNSTAACPHNPVCKTRTDI